MFSCHIALCCVSCKIATRQFCFWYKYKQLEIVICSRIFFSFFFVYSWARGELGREQVGCGPTWAVKTAQLTARPTPRTPNESRTQLDANPTEIMLRIFQWGDKETIQQQHVDLYTMGQANSREKALSQEMGQEWLHDTNCQLTEKETGRFFPNLYQENRLLLTHHFCIWRHFRNDFVDSATVSSLPTASQPALLLPRGVNGNKNIYSRFQNILFTTPWNMSS